MSDLEPMDEGELREEVERLHALLEGKSQYVDCCCPGCPRKIPEAWADGMCEPCADADCEHTGGARAVAAERDQARAQARRLEDESNEARRVAIVTERERDQARADLAKVVEERERLRGELAELNEHYAAMCAQVERLLPALHDRDRLRAVLAHTPENVAGVIASIENPKVGDAVWDGARILAALRARAGMETHDWGRDHPQHDVLCIDGSPPPAWSVVCDDVPDIVHARHDGHVCANPRPRLPR